MNALDALSCARCGQLDRAVLPGPGHCTCAVKRRRVAKALAAVCAGRSAVVYHDDLQCIVPEVAIRIVSYGKPDETTPRVMAYWAREQRNAA